MEKKNTVKSAAAEKKTVAETAKTAAKTDVKTTKPVTEKKPAAKTAAVKKTAAKPATEKTAAKAAAKPAAAKKTAAKKTTAKAAAKPAAKRTSKKTETVSVETICAKLEKKISKTKAAAVKEKIAVDIEVYGFADGAVSQKMYIEVNEGKVTIAPHSYNEKDFRIAVNFENAMAFADGKKTVKALLDDANGFYAEGNIAKAIKLAAIF